jgi:phage terminase Nu1 subunit (DNA packaging protein)
MKLLTVTALAQIHDKDRTTIRRRLRDLAPAKIEHRGKVEVRLYDADAAAALILEEGPGEELRAAFDRLHSARADKLELERAVRRGDVIELDKFAEELAERFENAKQRVLGIPQRYGQRLATINASMAGAERERAAADLLHEAMFEVVREMEMPLSFERLQ